MDSNEIESTYDVDVTASPENANLLYDSVADKFHRFLGWMQVSSAYQTQLDSEETVTVPITIQPSNRYYFIVSDSFKQNE